MKRTHRRLWFFVASSLAAACSSDDNAPNSSGSDASVSDATPADTSVLTDARASEGSVEASIDAAQATDAATPIDGGADASTSSEGGDAGSEASCGASLRVGVRVADYLLKTWPELDATPQDCTGPTNCFSMDFPKAPAGPSPKFWEYTYGVPLYGVQKLYDKTDDPKYLAFVRKYVDRYVSATGTIDYGRSWPLTADGGTLAPNDPTIQDVIQPSILLFGLYKKTGDARYLTAMASTRTTFKSIQKNSAGAFYHKPSYPNQQWLDGIYMSEPFLVKYGALYAETALAGDGKTCFDTATEQIKLVAQHTLDPGKKLYYHAWNGAADGVWLGLAPPNKVAPVTGTAVSPILWSRSIAWLFAGVIDVLDDLPITHADRPALLEIVKNIADGLKRYQDPESGLWYQVIDVMSGPLPANGGYPGETVAPAANWLETSASAIFAYGLAKSVRLGYLPAESRTVADNAWAGVKKKIDLGCDGSVNIHGTVVGMSVGGTFNAYTNADFRSDLTAALPPPAASTCPTTLAANTSAPATCKYICVRDNVPQAFGAVLLASSELEF